MSNTIQVLTHDPFPNWQLNENSQGVRLCGVREGPRVPGKDTRCYLDQRYCSEHSSMRPSGALVQDIERHRSAKRGAQWYTKACKTCNGLGYVLETSDEKGWATPTDSSEDRYYALEFGLTCPNIMCDEGRDRRSLATFEFSIEPPEGTSWPRKALEIVHV